MIYGPWGAALSVCVCAHASPCSFTMRPIENKKSISKLQTPRTSSWRENSYTSHSESMDLGPKLFIDAKARETEMWAEVG